MKKKENSVIAISVLLITILIAIIILSTVRYIKGKNNIEINNNEKIVFTFQKYDYELPTSYSAFESRENINQFVILSDNSNYDAYIELFDDEENILNEPYKLRQTLINNGYNVGEIENRQLENSNVLVMKYYNRGYNCLLAYLKAYDNKVYEITIYDNVNEEFNNSYLNDLLTILINAKYNND